MYLQLKKLPRAASFTFVFNNMLDVQEVILIVKMFTTLQFVPGRNLQIPDILKR